MSEFRHALGPINDLATFSPGFVWMYESNFGAYNNIISTQKSSVDFPEELRNDPLLMPQLSLWKDYASLRHFVMKSGHSSYVRRRREWFVKIEKPYSVCWYRDAKLDPPTLTEAFERLNALKSSNEIDNPFAFSFKKVVPKPPSAIH
eukprot:CAMPEP_0184866288 /NCGR_PEP_ID=MMETSP0580-20130426/21712_1 /TAXON_ID=1118495 /ORGANISM="Dactyliosolen fragilissimus" /LENGTH=146 /DNA_ID=CAMNT_0027365901 /DNA_START=158 /DNA_END=598 /DNA_ORIENTATION=+